MPPTVIPETSVVKINGFEKLEYCKTDFRIIFVLTFQMIVFERRSNQNTYRFLIKEGAHFPMDGGPRESQDETYAI